MKFFCGNKKGRLGPPFVYAFETFIQVDHPPLDLNLKKKPILLSINCPILGFETLVVNGNTTKTPSVVLPVNCDGAFV